jgi:hypothetical protein
MLPVVARMTDICHHALFFSIEMGVSQTFPPRMAQNHDPPISAFHISVLTDAHLYTQLLVEMNFFAQADLEM